MATSAAVPNSLLRTGEVRQIWSDELAVRARRLASSAFASSLAAVAGRVGTLSGRSAATAAWTRGVAAAFDAADVRPPVPRPRSASWAVPLPIADMVARVALFRALSHGGSRDRMDDLRWLLANRGGRYLRIDPRGDGRVVEVLGDLASARHVVVLVPGMSNDIDNYRTSLRTKASSLFDAMRREAGGDGVAVVSWLGYDTPDLQGAARSQVAKVAAAQLLADLDTIRSANRTAHLSVVGHSYGSVVLGRAMRTGIGVPTAVAVGSPGMGADDRDELGSRTTTLWAAKSTTAITVRLSPFLRLPIIGLRIGDPVALAPVHGEDPSAKGFGARRFPVGDIGGHGEYFDPGTVSVRSIARIALSRPPG